MIKVLRVIFIGLSLLMLVFSPTIVCYTLFGEYQERQEQKILKDQSIEVELVDIETILLDNIEATEKQYAQLNARLASLENSMDMLIAELEDLVVETTPITNRIAFTDEGFEAFAMLVQHEAGAESYECMLYTASAIVNRVLDDRYPDTLYGVVYDNEPVTQFSPVIKGLYKTPSALTLEACEEALIADRSEGSWIFNNRSLTNPVLQEWFENFELVADIDDVQFRR